LLFYFQATFSLDSSLFSKASISPRVGIQHKASPYVFVTCMVSCNTIKDSVFGIWFSHGSCENIQRDEELSRRSSSCATGRRESNAGRKPISVGQRDPTPGFCRANSSHRLRRMLRSPDWYLPSADGLMDCSLIRLYLKCIAQFHTSVYSSIFQFDGFSIIYLRIRFNSSSSRMM